MEQIKGYIGNKDILNHYKTAFLCSKKCPAEVILKAYDWAVEQREKGNCVITGAHSKIEKDVFNLLLKGKQPLILALARGLKKRIEPEIKKAIENNRLLVITPFSANNIRVGKRNALMRNELMVKIADEVFVAYADKGGETERLIKNYENFKKITLLT